MNKSIIILLLLLGCTACSGDVQISTHENYETVVLPDGSQVYLNHQSAISYEENFNPRALTLTGEAYFTVVSSESPFTVTTAHGTVEVLGTEFNVKTTSKQIAVDVKKGLVALKTTYETSKIKKGMKAIYTDGEETVQHIKSNREYREWIRSLQKELKKLGKELQPALKNIGNEFKKTGKNLGKEFKK